MRSSLSLAAVTFGGGLQPLCFAVSMMVDRWLRLRCTSYHRAPQAAKLSLLRMDSSKTSSSVAKAKCFFWSFGLAIVFVAVALVLGISEVTVKIHRRQVMNKMHAESLADLVRMSDKLKIQIQK